MKQTVQGIKLEARAYPDNKNNLTSIETQFGQMDSETFININKRGASGAVEAGLALGAAEFRVLYRQLRLISNALEQGLSI